MPVRAIVVDDEALARRRIRDLLAKEPEVELIAECAGGDEAVGVILRGRPDLVFLDVQMPDRDGFAVVEAVGADRMPAVIFVTAYDHYAYGPLGGLISPGSPQPRPLCTSQI
jgi:two-component system, LytTR family, response regulator